jgi:hypothetical protein
MMEKAERYGVLQEKKHMRRFCSGLAAMAVRSYSVHAPPYDIS